MFAAAATRARLCRCSRQGLGDRGCCSFVLSEQRPSNQANKLSVYSSLYHRLPSRLFRNPESRLLQFDPALFANFSETICHPRCGNPIVELNEVCHGDDRNQVTEFLVQLCAENGQGNRCYAADVVSAVNATFADSECSATLAGNTTSCSPSCRSKLQATVEAVGCCITIFDVNVLFAADSTSNTTRIIREVCGVDLPGLCSGSTVQQGKKVTWVVDIT